jgi:hypothetical protein
MSARGISAGTLDFLATTRRTGLCGSAFQGQVLAADVRLQEMEELDLEIVPAVLIWSTQRREDY